jgi:hypothetical protein
MLIPKSRSSEARVGTALVICGLDPCSYSSSTSHTIATKSLERTIQQALRKSDDETLGRPRDGHDAYTTATLLRLLGADR